MPELGPQLVFILGITNIIGLLLVLLSCRCTLRIKSFQRSRFYMWLYKYHCYYWYFFLISVFLHAVLAILVFGRPF